MVGVVHVFFELVAEYVTVKKFFTELVFANVVQTFSGLCTVGIVRRRRSAVH